MLHTRQHVSQGSGHLAFSARYDTPSRLARVLKSYRSAAGRAVFAAAMLSTLGLVVIGGAPESARAAESTDGLIRISFIPGASEARYIMQIRMFGQAPKAAICSTRDLTGQLVLTPEGSVVPELSQVHVNQRSLRCAAPLRDDMNQQLLQTAQYPTSTFTAQSAPGLPVPLAPGPQKYQMVGEQVVRGVARTVTYDTAGDSTADEFIGSSRAVIKMSEFGVSPPPSPLYSVDDEMVAEIDIKAEISAPPAPAADVAQ